MPLVFRTQADPDLWGHIRFGLDLLATHALPRVDPYSFTQDLPWVNHEWLSELIMASAWRFGGTLGLSLLKGTLVLLVFFVVLSAYADASPFVLSVVLLLTAVGSGRVAVTLRPQLWSLLCVAILCRLLMAGPRRWWLVALPTLFMLWANLHGGWIVGAAILAIWVTCNFWSDRSARPLLLGVASLSALSTWLNPYGWRLWLFLVETVRVSRSISEWQPLLTTPVVAWIPWFVVAIGVAISVAAKARPSADRFAIAVFLAAASFRVERLSSFFVVAVLVLWSPTLTAQWPAVSRAFDPISRRVGVILSLSLTAVALASALVTLNAASCIPISGDWSPDRIAGRALVEGRIKGRMVTWFDWGEYAIWHLSPSVLVSLDGRRETVYSDVVLRNHEEMDAATPEGLAYLQQLNPDYVWLPASLTKVRDWLAVHRYRIDVLTARSFIAVRNELPVVKVSTAPLAACFPGP